MTAELLAKIVKQFEYYFSDSNIANDKFLRGKISEAAEGWLDLELFFTFKRVESMVKSDMEVLLAALSSNETPNNYELNITDKKIRKKGAVDSSYDIVSNSVCVKLFPRDVTIEQLEDFFTQQGVAYNSIKIRKNKTYQKDSCFVELVSHEEYTRVMAMQLVYNEVPLEIHDRAAFQAIKDAEEAEKQLKRKNNSGPEKEAKHAERVNQAVKDMLQHNCLIKFDTVGPETDRDVIRDAFAKYISGAITFVGFSRGQTEGYIRLELPEAQEVMQKISVATEADPASVFSLNGVTPVLSIITGDEEFEVWKSTYLAKVAFKESRKRPSNNSRSSRRSESDAGSNKRQKTSNSDDANKDEE